jgi:methylase of polypeptide subunit release factors
MTELLKKAFEEASKLPPKEQDAFAALVLAELEAEKAWDQAFAQSHQALSSLAREALEDLTSGRTDVLDPESL